MSRSRSNDTYQQEDNKLPHPLLALLPVIVLILLVGSAVFLFGGDALSGGSQMALLLATAICLIIGKLVENTSWNSFEEHLYKNLKSISVALLILLTIGAISGTWMISGVVPMFIVYGMKIIHPSVFLVATCAICALVSVMTGSSWTTIATIGIALMGIGRIQGFPEGWIAGAIISGAYFGDKISPLSDTTILASSITGTPLFTHVRYMMITTVPTFVITLIVFTIAGLSFSTGTINMEMYEKSLRSTFHITPWLLLVPAITFYLIVKRYPPVLTLFTSMIIAAVFAIIFQRGNLLQIAGNEGNSLIYAIKGAIITCSGSTALDCGIPEINNLISTGGMAGMMNTIWLILCAVCFGAAMSATRMIESITRFMIQNIKNTVGLVSSTVAIGLFANMTMSDQYLSLILSGNMFKDVYEKRGYESRLLSRTMEDSVTVTSALVPWNSGGMTQSTVLSVPTLTYLPYCVFDYLSPVMSIVVASIGYKIFRKTPESIQTVVEK